MTGWASYSDQNLEKNLSLWRHVLAKAINNKQRERAKRVIEEIEREQKFRGPLKPTAQS
jgi:hypothetical protein